MNRKLARAVCRFWVAVLLLAQLAVAAYACTGLAPAQNSEPASTALTRADFALVALPAATTMADCQDGATADTTPMSKLCADHCRLGQQGDQSSQVQLPIPALNRLYDLAPEPTLPAPARMSATALGELVLAARSHAILHCVRRT